MTGPVRFGVLGASAVAWQRVLPAMESCAQAEIVAVASRSQDKLTRFADRFGCAGSGYEALLDRDDIDAVYVSLPTALHSEWTARALRAGKHVLVEKPIATTADEARTLARLAGDRGLVLRENFMFLHHPQHGAVAGLISKGRLGDLRSFHASFCIPPLPAEDIRYVPGLGGGALLDVGVYPLRAATLFLGHELAVAGATLRVRPEDGLDLAGQALLVSASGVLASVDFGFEHSYGSRYALWGAQARVTLDRAFTPPAGYQPVLRLEEQDHVEQFTLPPADQAGRSVAAFAAAAVAAGAAGAAGARAEGGEVGAGPEEARWRAEAVAAAELVDAIRERAVRVAVGG